VNQSKGLFACAAEDGHVSVWRALGGGKVEHHKYLSLEDSQMTGVAFVGATSGSLVAATAYDYDAVVVWSTN